MLPLSHGNQRPDMLPGSAAASPPPTIAVNTRRHAIGTPAQDFLLIPKTQLKPSLSLLHFSNMASDSTRCATVW